MPVPSVEVRNLTGAVQHLRSADGDSTSVMPRATCRVRLKFVDWAPPSPKTIYINKASLAEAKALAAKHAANAPAPVAGTTSVTTSRKNPFKRA